MKTMANRVALLASFASCAGCSDERRRYPLPWIVDCPGFECPSPADAPNGVSGIREVDAFFAAVATLHVRAKTLKADVKFELVNIATLLGVEDARWLDLPELNAAIKAQLDSGIGGMLEGNLTLGFAPPKCEVSTSAAIVAAAKCDAALDPKGNKLECTGSCEIESSAMAYCAAPARLTCKGTAPAFECDGTCTGACELDAAVQCEGTCKGTCEVAVETDCDGTFTPSPAADANGRGTCKLNGGARCNGKCIGVCELTAGGNCEGSCKGECEYAAPSRECPLGTVAKCEADAERTVTCSGKCDGQALHPKIKAECQASAQAAASFDATCTPPKVEPKYTLSGRAKAMFAGNVEARAAFEGQLRAIAKSFAILAAKGANADTVLMGSADLTASGSAVVEAALERAKGEELPIGAVLDLACGIEGLSKLPASIVESTRNLLDATEAVADCSAVFTSN